MRDYFQELAALLPILVADDEYLGAHIRGEVSDFVRFNHARIRQAGRVRQQTLAVDLVQGQRHATAELGLTGDPTQDRGRLTALLAELREILPLLPEDPHLQLPPDPSCSESIQGEDLPDSSALVAEILAAVAYHDMVGILASGPVYHGFCDTRGQRNWHQQASFNLDFSLYLHQDRAVKSRYAGTRWDSAGWLARVAAAERQLALLGRPARTLDPGEYRAFVAPEALEEITDLLGWRGFGLQSHRTRSTPLLAMIENDARLDPRVRLVEHTEAGLAPDFQASGFRRPPRVTLIERGRYRDCLVSPRSAAEYGVPCNGADAAEAPLSLAMDPGGLATGEALAALDRGLYIGNLWYLNYSDANAGRITGMTRFGTFWVEGGELREPVQVMRFDDTLYRMLGEALEEITREQSLLLDPGSYGRRSSRSSLLPGLLLSKFRLTL